MTILMLKVKHMPKLCAHFGPKTTVFKGYTSSQQTNCWSIMPVASSSFSFFIKADTRLSFLNGAATLKKMGHSGETLSISLKLLIYYYYCYYYCYSYVNAGKAPIPDSELLLFLKEYKPHSKEQQTLST